MYAQCAPNDFGTIWAQYEKSWKYSSTLYSCRSALNWGWICSMNWNENKLSKINFLIYLNQIESQIHQSLQSSKAHSFNSLWCKENHLHKHKTHIRDKWNHSLIRDKWMKIMSQIQKNGKRENDLSKITRLI